MSGAHLENAELVSAHLEKATLTAAHLEGTELFDAHLEKAILINTFLDGTRLSGAHLKNARMSGAKFTSNTKMHSVDWDDYVLGEEIEGEKKGQKHYLMRAAEIYRKLKVWYSNDGIYDTAGEFFFREMTAKRKMLKWCPNPIPRAWSKFLSLICGYGEKPLRVFWWTAAVILGLALIYTIIGSVWGWAAFWRALYFSSVSFTDIGYGGWVTTELTNNTMRWLGVFESFIGVFSMALFLVTFTRKMTR